MLVRLLLATLLAVSGAACRSLKDSAGSQAATTEPRVQLVGRFFPGTSETDGTASLPQVRAVGAVRWRFNSLRCD